MNKDDGRFRPMERSLAWLRTSGNFTCAESVPLSPIVFSLRSSSLRTPQAARCVAL
jgi:hypothetical protein